MSLISGFKKANIGEPFKKLWKKCVLLYHIHLFDHWCQGAEWRQGICDGIGAFIYTIGYGSCVSIRCHAISVHKVAYRVHTLHTTFSSSGFHHISITYLDTVVIMWFRTCHYTIWRMFSIEKQSRFSWLQKLLDFKRNWRHITSRILLEIRTNVWKYSKIPSSQW